MDSLKRLWRLFVVQLAANSRRSDALAHCIGYFKTDTFSQRKELNNIVHEGLIIIIVRRALPLNTSN